MRLKNNYKSKSKAPIIYRTYQTIIEERILAANLHIASAVYIFYRFLFIECARPADDPMACSSNFVKLNDDNHLFFVFKSVAGLSGVAPLPWQRRCRAE